MYAATDMTCNHLHGYNGVTEKIKRAMYDAAKQFVYIGFLLKEVRDYKYYEESGFDNVYEYAEFELGFKKSSTKNFIAIAETFGINEYTYAGRIERTQTMHLQPKYEKFNYSQLVELLAMSDAKRDKATPDMTVKQLRELKKEPIVEQIAIEELEEKTNGQTSGQEDKTTACTLNNVWKDIDPDVIKEICAMTGKRYNKRSNYKIEIKAIPKPEDKILLRQYLCYHAGIKYDPTKNDYGITIELIEK